jgi:ankyrin repeat protein
MDSLILCCFRRPSIQLLSEALVKAAQQGSSMIVEYLLESGVNVNAQLWVRLAPFGCVGDRFRSDITLGPVLFAGRFACAGCGRHARAHRSGGTPGCERSGSERHHRGEWFSTQYLCLGNPCVHGGLRARWRQYERATPLMDAARNGHLEIVEYLTAQGAYLNMKNRVRDHDVAQLMCTRIECTLQDGYTALLLACRHGHRSVFEHLLQQGAELDVTGQIGQQACLAG